MPRGEYSPSPRLSGEGALLHPEFKAAFASLKLYRLLVQRLSNRELRVRKHLSNEAGTRTMRNMGARLPLPVVSGRYIHALAHWLSTAPCALIGQGLTPIPPAKVSQYE